MATSRNEITGDAIKTKATNDSYSDGWDRIFGKKKTKEQEALLDDAIIVYHETRLPEITHEG